MLLTLFFTSETSDPVPNPPGKNTDLDPNKTLSETKPIQIKVVDNSIGLTAT